MSIFSSKLTYGDFRRTGVQDCQNAVSIDEFDYEGGGTPRQIVERTWAQWIDDGMKDQWFEQNDDFEDLDPEKCFEAWADGWKGRAEGYVENELKRRARDEHDNPARDPYYVDDGSGHLIPEHASFEAALDDAMTRVMRGRDAEVKIVNGSEVEGFAEVATVMPLDQYNGRHASQLGEAEVIVIIDDQQFVPRDFEPGYMFDVEYGKRRMGGMRDKSTVAFVSIEQEMTTNPPAKWWRRPAPTKERICYRTKIEALTKFLEVNYQIVENYGGADYQVSPSEFDAINHKYDLKGKKAVRTIADAVWAAMPVGKPYCLDRIDLDALNDTSPAREAGAAFVLPDSVYAAQMAAQEAAHYAPVASVGDIPEPDWVTDHEPKRVFPPIPAMPMRAHLQRRDSQSGSRGVETYQMLPPLPLQGEVKPMRVELEDQEPGVATFRFNPAGKVKIKMTSTRSGNVGWIRSDGTPSNHEGDAGYFTPAEAQATIDEYTATLVRTVGRCANRFDMVPTKNPPTLAIGNYYDVVTSDGQDQFQIIGYFDGPDGHRRWRVEWMDGRLNSIDERSLSQYQAKFSHHDHVAQPKIGNPAARTPNMRRGKYEDRVRIKVIYTGAKYDDNDMKIRDVLEDWHTGSGTDFETGEVDHTARVPASKVAATIAKLKKIKGVKQVVNQTAEAEREAKENPAWVTKILAKHYVKLEEQVPSKWLPKLTATKVQGGKLVAAMKEYGCGAYGCVLPTLDPQVVLKLTTDSTEAQFAHDLASKLTAPVVVKYHLTRELPDKYKKRDTFLLWRDSAEHVDKVEQTIAEEGGTDVVVVEEAIAAQHKAAQEAFDALHEGRDATKLLQKWEDACREMGLLVPELSELAEGMITNLHNDKVFFGDVHSGNIGMVNGRWVVVDPGHVAVLEE